MAALTVGVSDRTGDTKTYQTCNAGGDTVVNDGKTVLHFKCTGGTPVTVTLDSTRPCDQGFDHNETVVVAATTGDEIAGPWPVNRYGGTLTITYTGVTGLTCAPVSMSGFAAV
jgi:hypothetical protein